jgi:cellulose synthase/poly-beta-1,6-N-acetylglucosamine synthase-like glycosyltransferase
LKQNFDTNSYDIIVVNNRSNDNTENVIRRYPIRYLFEAKPGPAAARNSGIRASNAHFVAFTDADCIPDPDWLTQMISEMKPGVAGGGGTIVSYYGDDLISRYIDEIVFRQRYNILQKVPPHITTANACYVRSALSDIGLFDESFPYAAGEDRDLGERLAVSGCRFVFVPSAIVRHRHPQTLEGFYNQRFRHASGQFYADLKLLNRLSIRQMITKDDISYLLGLSKQLIDSKLSKEERYQKLLKFVDRGAYLSGLILRYLLYLVERIRMISYNFAETMLKKLL